jgi:hypothetical protein
MRLPQRRSGRSLFETLPLLLGADIGDDVVDLVVVEARDRCHLSEVPVMLLGPIDDGRAEGVVAVMVGFIDDRQVRGPLVGALQIGTMARRTIGLVQITAATQSCRMRLRSGRVPPLPLLQSLCDVATAGP